MEAAAEERAVMMAEAMHLTAKHEIHAEMEDHGGRIDPWSRLSADEVDAAARVLHPVFHGYAPGVEPLRGVFLKDYVATEW